MKKHIFYSKTTQKYQQENNFFTTKFIQNDKKKTHSTPTSLKKDFN